jgi:hypothetical protein
VRIDQIEFEFVNLITRTLKILQNILKNIQQKYLPMCP